MAEGVAVLPGWVGSARSLLDTSKNSFLGRIALSRGARAFAKSAPQGVPGSEYAISALKSGVETSMAAFETVAKATKEGVEYAGTQVKAAAKSAPKRK